MKGRFCPVFINKLYLLEPGREHEFTGKKHRFFPVEDVIMQGKGFEHQFTGIKIHLISVESAIILNTSNPKRIFLLLLK
jgi:hypothetical protein